MKGRKKDGTSSALSVQRKAITTDLTPSEISADSKIVRALPIRQRIGWLINHAHRHAMAFQSPESFMARSLHSAQHPTALVSFKCMDGRINLALIIGPYSPDLADPIRKAAGIIDANMKAHRIPDDGFLLLAESPYDEVGSDRARAILRSCFLSQFAAEIIRTEFPSLKAKLHVRSAVIAWQSRVMELIDCGAA